MADTISSVNFVNSNPLTATTTKLELNLAKIYVCGFVINTTESIENWENRSLNAPLTNWTSDGESRPIQSANLIIRSASIIVSSY